MRETCGLLAVSGVVAICPDRFGRIEPGIDITDKTRAEWDRAFGLFGLFDVDKGIADLQATLAQVRGHEACNGKAGSVGYCLGGKPAYLMATRSDADRSEEHTSELQSLMRIPYAVFCLKQQKMIHQRGNLTPDDQTRCEHTY